MAATLLLGALALLSCPARAAPHPIMEEIAVRHGESHGAEENYRTQPRHVNKWPKLGRPHYGHGHARPVSMNHTNSSTIKGTGSTSSRTWRLPYHTPASASTSLDCPVIFMTATTTIDVTVYITATAPESRRMFKSPEPCPEDTPTQHHGWNSSLTPTTTTAVGSSSYVRSEPSWGPSASPMKVPLYPEDTLSAPQGLSTTSTTTLTTTLGATITTTVHIEQHTKVITANSTEHSSQTRTAIILPSDPCDDELSSSSRTTSSVSVSSTSTTSGPAKVTEPCDDEYRSSTTMILTPTSPITHSPHVPLVTSRESTSITGMATSTHTSTQPPVETESCHDEVLTQYTRFANTSSFAVKTSASSTTRSWESEKSITSVIRSFTVTPFYTESTSSFTSTSSSTGVSSSTSSSTSTSTSIASSTSTRAYPTEKCVIDTSMVPVTTAPLTSIPTSTTYPTKTVCQNNAPSGRPMAANSHCGVHGLPVGNYFLAEFVENSPGVPVTLEGCYQFCASVMEATDGCKSYRFYPEEGLGAPRCDLYGSTVAYALDSIDNYHPDMWFDLGCGSPASKRWEHLPGLKRLRQFGLY